MKATPTTAGDIIAVGEQLASEAARFTSLGWMRGTSGNLSVVLDREPLRMAVTASGVDKGELAPTDVVLVDDQGTRVDVHGLPSLQPSAEAELHACIAASTGANAVVHVHALSAVLAADRWPDGVHLRDIEMLKGIGRAADGDEVVVPVIANSQDMSELAIRFVTSFDAAVPAVIVARHGMYVWGRDLTQARHHTESLEWALSFALATTPREEHT
jgi:methylthioribulose-1-phosphate dehydratase